MIRSKLAYTFILILVQWLKMLKWVLYPESCISERGLFLFLFFPLIHKMRENENLLMLSVSSSAKCRNWGKILSHSVLVGLKWALTLRINSGRVFTIPDFWGSLELPLQIMIISQKNYQNVAQRFREILLWFLIFVTVNIIYIFVRNCNFQFSLLLLSED